MSQATQTGQPGRYQRSAGGLVGAMVVLVLVVVAFVVFRGAFRDTPEYQPEHVDYRQAVAEIQRLGLEPAYPARLPDGWYVKQATFERGERPAFDLAMTTDTGRFAGLHEEDRDLDELVDTYVDAAATEGARVRLPGSVATTWRTFTDAGGDHAYAAEVGRNWVLVYGSADPAGLRALVTTLTTRQVD